MKNNKLIFSLLLLILFNCLSLYLQKYTSIKGENIKVFRDRELNYGKLPDLIQDISPNLSHYSYLTDKIIKMYIILFICLVSLNDNIYDITTNSFILVSMILFFRMLMFSSTILPSINTNCHRKKKNRYKKKFINILYDFITQKYETGYCNDYIFSGHNAIFILLTLLISYYNLLSGGLVYLLWIFTIIFSLISIICRNHYTIDVILAYFITFSIFHGYYRK